jgi:ribosomal protein S20
MAITANAKKAHRASLKKHKKSEAAESLSAAFKALDKAAKTGVIKKNNASRRKSRLAKALAKVS